MAIYRLLAEPTDAQLAVFGPNEVAVLTAAYEQICRELQLTEHQYAPANEAVARKVIDIARSGELDPKRLVDGVLAALRLPPN